MHLYKGNKFLNLFCLLILNIHFVAFTLSRDWGDKSAKHCEDDKHVQLLKRVQV